MIPWADSGVAWALKISENTEKYNESQLKWFPELTLGVALAAQTTQNHWKHSEIQWKSIKMIPWADSGGRLGCPDHSKRDRYETNARRQAIPKALKSGPLKRLCNTPYTLLVYFGGFKTYQKPTRIRRCPEMFIFCNALKYCVLSVGFVFLSSSCDRVVLRRVSVKVLCSRLYIHT